MSEKDILERTIKLVVIYKRVILVFRTSKSTKINGEENRRRLKMQN